MAKRASEIIAFHLCWNISDVTEGRYQRYTAPSVYVCANDYFCCPAGNQSPPKGVSENEWQKVGSYYGRNVWRVSP